MNTKNTLYTAMVALAVVGILTIQAYTGYLHMQAAAAWCATHSGHPLYCLIPRWVGPQHYWLYVACMCGALLLASAAGGLYFRYAMRRVEAPKPWRP